MLSENEEKKKYSYLEGFMLHFKDAEETIRRGESRMSGSMSGAPSQILIEALRKYIRLTVSYDPFDEMKEKKSEAYNQLKNLMTPNILKEYKETNSKLAEKIIEAEDRAFKTDFEIMVAYVLSYDGEKNALDTLSFFYQEYVEAREREKVEKFCSREKKFENAKSTGFNTLDEILEGGLYPGLYVIGAASSSGKTTFCIQLSDQIASCGNKVLFFSLEMSEEELISKSLSRLTYVMDKDPLKRRAKSERKLTSKKYREEFSEEEWELLNDSAGFYERKILSNKSIVESYGEYGVREIERDIKNYIETRREKPVVFIDYLQILKPLAENMTDKQNTDRNVSALKRICRDYGITVFVISSFNRASYNQNAGMEAFKESGAIEYSADAVFSLQPDGAKFASEQDKKAIAENRELFSSVRKLNVRPMKLSVLKNRRGKCGDEILYEYNCVFGLFREKGIKDENEQKTVVF